MLKSFQWINRDVARESPGIKHETFASVANHAEVGYYIALPEGYTETANRNKTYPVIYFLHGGRPGSEAKGLNGYANFNATRAGEAMPPHIFVTVNGGKLSHYDYDGVYGVKAFLELVQHVDQTYRTVADRQGRVLIGTSQGGRGVGRYLFRYADLFATGVSICGGHQRELIISENNGSELNGVVIPDGSNNVFDNARAYTARGDAVPAVNLMIVVGDEDENYPGNLQWCIELNRLGINHQLVVVPGTGHNVDYNIESTRERIWHFMATGIGS